MLNDLDNTLGMMPSECNSGDVACWVFGPFGTLPPFTGYQPPDNTPDTPTQPAGTHTPPVSGQVNSPTPSLGQPPTAAQNQQLISGIDNTTLLLIGGAVGLILLLR